MRKNSIEADIEADHTECPWYELRHPRRLGQSWSRSRRLSASLEASQKLQDMSRENEPFIMDAVEQGSYKAYMKYCNL